MSKLKRLEALEARNHPEVVRYIFLMGMESEEREFNGYRAVYKGQNFEASCDDEAKASELVEAWVESIDPDSSVKIISLRWL